jgi:1-pyrroline-5-carboxylate dehydrogenase
LLATSYKASEKEVNFAIDAAIQVHQIWLDLLWTTRASILLKAAELISGKYRALLNAATMLGQSKNIYQAGIDAVCETIDFMEFNAYFACRIYGMQPKSALNQLNKMEFRPLEVSEFQVAELWLVSIIESSRSKEFQQVP